MSESTEIRGGRSEKRGQAQRESPLDPIQPPSICERPVEAPKEQGEELEWTMLSYLPIK